MREPKYLNESGSQQGKWFLNRFDYFEFYGFEGELTIKIIAFITLIASLYFIPQLSIFLMPLMIWLAYVSGLTLYILRRKHCKFHGYLLYPSRLVKTFKYYEKQIDMEDFDSVASLSNTRNKQ